MRGGSLQARLLLLPQFIYDPSKVFINTHYRYEQDLAARQSIKSIAKAIAAELLKNKTPLSTNYAMHVCGIEELTVSQRKIGYIIKGVLGKSHAYSKFSIDKLYQYIDDSEDELFANMLKYAPDDFNVDAALKYFSQQAIKPPLLYAAIQSSNIRIIHTLLTAGATFDLHSQDGEKSFAVVAQNNHFDVIKIILSYIEKHDFNALYTVVKSYPNLFPHISSKTRTDKEFVNKACQQNCAVRLFIKQENINDPELVLQVVKEDWRALRFAGPGTKNKSNIVFAAIKQDWRALKYAGDSVNSEPWLLFIAINQSWKALKYAGDKAKNNPAIVLAAFKKCSFAVYHASDELLSNPEFILNAVKINPQALDAANDAMKKDLKFIHRVVKVNGRALFYACNEAKNNYTIVRAAIKQNCWALSSAGEKLRNNIDLVLMAIEQDFLMILYAGKIAQNDSRIILAAIKKNCSILQYLSKEVKNNPVFVLAAIEQNYLAFQFASMAVKSDTKTVRAAIDIDWRSIKYASIDARNNPEIMLYAIEKNYLAMYDAGNIIRSDPIFIIAALKEHPDIISFVRVKDSIYLQLQALAEISDAQVRAKACDKLRQKLEQPLVDEDNNSKLLNNTFSL